ncbi:Cysteine-rich secretory protein family protein [Streptomyces sp. 3213]|uniref:CAP domain-containing protein n=1 Tax=Streptomyces sp. 3213.3 TaxID=1855348 RepID=UPI00089BF4FB|nr:CAP domain-containing protein [Streptomyces sp. 3213.3]SEE95347.1 Cysteine-rich secretory protein family protein [Streptomyces sp. 3213] [Streptomyces sp. 3213.3]
MNELVPGGNLPLPGGAMTLRVPGPFDVSALITDESGKVGGDGDFVFYNQPTVTGARLQGDTLTVDPARLRAGAARVTVVVSPADPGTPLGRLPAPTLHVADAGSRPLARFTPARPQRETVLLLAELYRRGTGWKLRALGQGYADGLASIARDFGVDIVEDTAPGPASGPRRGENTAPGAGGSPAADPTGFLALVNSARAQAGSPPVTLDPRLASAAQAHVSDMAAAGHLSTESRDGTSVYQRVIRTGYAYLTVGEHLVSGPRNPAEFVDYCLRTEQARRTLLERVFTHTGLAQAVDSRSGDVYWTALWARPLTARNLAGTADKVVELTNAERTRAGLRPLAVDPLLAAAAQAHSADMVARAFYSHTSPDGSQPWDRAAAAGSRRRTIGENIACGQRSPAEVVEGWMNSPGHRANILKPDFTHIGIGFAGGGQTGTYWTQLFGA